MRCSHCNFYNLPGVMTCQVCGSQIEWVVCNRCRTENPTGYQFCGHCGHPLPLGGAPAAPRAAARDISQAPEPRPEHGHSRAPSPVALIGFGAILALASAAYPWYLFGGSTAPGSEEQSISRLLQLGWQRFPGIPLTLIALCAVLSTLMAIMGGWGRLHPVASTVLGLVTLFAAAWLWQGYQAPQGGTVAGPGAPATGAILVTVGAIVLIATGLWMFRALRSR